MGNSIYFSKDEQRLAAELGALFNEWMALIKTKKAIEFADDKKFYPAIDYFNTDGFYPGYLLNKIKVLFIGREGRYEAGKDRIQSDLKIWRENPDLCLNTPFWRRVFYILYGIRTDGKFSFGDIPPAINILNEMNRTGNYGFAFMNISKYANGSENGGSADYNLINRFLADSELDKRNFLREEIQILNPDVIIAMNLWNGKIDQNELDKVFPPEDFSGNLSKQKNISVYNFSLNGKNVKFLDMYHFSSPKSDREDFYEPAMSAIFG